LKTDAFFGGDFRLSSGFRLRPWQCRLGDVSGKHLFLFEVYAVLLDCLALEEETDTSRNVHLIE